MNIPILLAWLLFHFSTNVYHLYGGLCLAGLSGGLMEAPVLTYVAEVTQPKYRGMLAATGSTCVILGVFTQVNSNPLSNQSWSEFHRSFFLAFAVVSSWYILQMANDCSHLCRFPTSVDCCTILCTRKSTLVAVKKSSR